MVQRYCWLVISTLFLIAIPVQAQIVPDETLGRDRSRIVPAAGIDSIEGGSPRGTNLFHSFSQFNVGEGQRVYFANPTGISNIFTRVTGNSASNILGTLGVTGTADLFLINPNGILFGQNARLDVRGSFVGTTANGVRFGDQGSFDTTNPTAPALLTVQPSALLFTQIQGGAIVNRAQSAETNGLSVPTGQSLSLVGGNVLFEGGQASVPGGRIEIGGLAAPGEVTLTNNQGRFQLGFPTGVQRADLLLQGGFIANIGGIDDIVLTGSNVSILGAPLLPLLIEGTSTAQEAGHLVVNATGNVTLDFTNRTETPFDQVSPQDIGGVTIAGENISFIFTAFGVGGGEASRLGRDFVLTAINTVSLDNSTLETISNPLTGSAAGDIRISARNLNLSNRSGIFTLGTAGQNEAGNITLNVTDTVSLSGVSEIATIADIQGRSRESGGAINVRAGNLSLNDFSAIFSEGDINVQANTVSLVDGRITAFSQGEGRNGDISINVTGAMTLDQGLISSTSQNSGTAGNTTIQTGSLFLLDSVVSTESTSTGDSGNLTITASDAIELRSTGSQFTGLPNGTILLNSQLTTGNFGLGSAGNLTLNTGRLSVLDGSFVIASSSNNQPGAIAIKASGLVEVAGVLPNQFIADLLLPGQNRQSLISASTAGGVLPPGNASENSALERINQLIPTIRLDPLATGDSSGNLSIEAQSLSVRDQGIITTASLNSNGNGTIRVRVGDLMLSNRGEIVSNAIGSGQADSGDIEIHANNLLVLNGSLISATADNNGNGGNVTVNALNSIDVSGAETEQNPDGTQSTFLSSISSRATGTGNGGQITLNTRQLNIRDSGKIETIAPIGSAGQAGAIQINATESVELSGENDIDRFPSSIFSASVGTGDAGNLQITTGRLSLKDDTAISTSSLQSNSDSRGGEIVINADALDILDGSRIASATFSRGAAGDILLNVRDRVRLQGIVQEESGLFASSLGAGEGGNITINAEQLEVLDRAAVSVIGNESGKAGDINVNAPLVRLSNQGRISAFSASTDGGNIAVNADAAVLLRQNSNISTSAGTLERGGNGGDVEINTGFLLSRLNEDNTIQANAFTGRGGNVSIEAQNVFGIEPASNLIPGQSTITASSALGVQGEISITQPEVQPTQGTIELPTEPIDASNQINQVCQQELAGQTAGRFVVSGRGSVPPSPTDPLSGTDVFSALATPTASSTPAPISAIAPPELIEAQGWVKNRDGSVKLIAKQPASTAATPPVCPVPN